MNRAIFLDDDGSYAYVVGSREYCLGRQRPDGYIWASDLNGGNRWQLCQGGGRMGSTLTWPHGPLQGWRDANDRMGRPMQVPVYDAASTDRVLRWLAKCCTAKVYRSRAAFDRYYRGRA